MDQTLVTRIVEAALLAANQPLTLVQLKGLFLLDEPAPEGSIETALDTLRQQSAERGVELVEVASGWRFQVQADVHAWVARLWNERQTKYTRATLETLALIAYRQPITRGEIEQVRGVATNSNIIKALEEREWIRVVGHRDIPGRPELLGTTKGFLDYFGLKRLDELPPLSELKDFGELEPQFEFEGQRAVGGIATGDADDAGTDPAANDAERDDRGDQDAGDHHDDDGIEQGEAPTDAGPEADAPHDGEAGTQPEADASDDVQREVEAETDTHDVAFDDDATDTDNALAEEGDSTGVRNE